MPLMPAPPMPTKWMCLTLCFMPSSLRRCRRRRPAGSRPAGRARARPLPSRAAADDPATRASCASVAALSSACGQRERGAGVDQEPRVGALVVGDRTRQRHDQRADPGGGELGDGQRAGAADHEVGGGVARRHVVDEGHALASTPAPRIGGAQRLDVLRARPGGRPAGVARRASAPAPPARMSFSAARRGCRRRPAAAAALCGRRSAPRAAAPRDLGAHRVADPRGTPRVRALQCVGKAQQHAVGAVREHPVGEPRHRVGVVHDQRPARRDAHQRAGKRREAAQSRARRRARAGE